MTIEKWPRSTQEVFYADDTPARCDWPCQVRMGDGLIEVIYDEGDGSVVHYSGTENGPGHFALEAPERSGRATLHLFHGGKFLDGYWCEERSHGMWRITLRRDRATKEQATSAASIRQSRTFKRGAG